VRESKLRIALFAVAVLIGVLLSAFFNSEAAFARVVAAVTAGIAYGIALFNSSIQLLTGLLASRPLELIATITLSIGLPIATALLARKRINSRSKAVLIILLVLVASIGSTTHILGQLATFMALTSSGVVKTVGVGVYWDESCSKPVTSIDWGMVEPGSQKNQSVYIRNEGNADITLSLNTENWNPASASNYITLTWDYDNRTLAPNQVIAVTLTLSVLSNITEVESFTFTIVITAEG